MLVCMIMVLGAAGDSSTCKHTLMTFTAVDSACEGPDVAVLFHTFQVVIRHCAGLGTS